MDTYLWWAYDFLPTLVNALYCKVGGCGENGVEVVERMDG